MTIAGSRGRQWPRERAARRQSAPVCIELFDTLDPAHKREVARVVRRLMTKSECKRQHQREFRAIVKFHTGTKSELERSIADPAPSRRELSA